MATIAKLVGDICGPVNVLTSRGTPPVRDLEQIGVARLSDGSGIMRGALAWARDAARELFDRGSYETFLEIAIPYGAVNELMGSDKLSARCEHIVSSRWKRFEMMRKLPAFMGKPGASQSHGSSSGTRIGNRSRWCAAGSTISDDLTGGTGGRTAPEGWLGDSQDGGWR